MAKKYHNSAAGASYVKTNKFNDAVSRTQYASAKIHDDMSKPSGLPTEGRQEFWDMSKSAMPENIAYGIKEIDKQIGEDVSGVRAGIGPRKT